MSNQYETDIIIDETALDVEWLNQPRLILKYGRLSADAGMNMDLAKENLNFVRAELDKSIRMDPESYEIAKVTETAINAAILAHEDYRMANDKFIRAQYEFNVALAAVRAFEQRKSALENLVKLHGQQYFAGPSIPRDLNREWQEKERQKRSNAAVGETFKRTRS